ncbi:MAG: sigma-70 family RNA polymerase sigma factor [Proteobacteria bacterium]|nr:sigma-70 family RNA polymerase sigma factor [Pseudomonadota bacterium]
MVTAENKNKILSDLMRLALDGNQVAYAQFLTQVATLLRSVVAKKITSADVEDVTQEILLSIHKARHTYDCDRAIMPWIFSIARFRITDYLRKHYSQMRHKAADVSELENILADVTDTTSNNELIEEWLEDVPEKHKQILIMMHVEGYTVKEVAARIGMNESAVKVAAHRAIKKIRNKFKT